MRGFADRRAARIRTRTDAGRPAVSGVTDDTEVPLFRRMALAEMALSPPHCPRRGMLVTLQLNDERERRDGERDPATRHHKGRRSLGEGFG